ncbi:MAG: hypothetical protein JSS02_28935, partial [Planctomycetes bacterium]|nr:hypothetical protein [Planctomycetota bacterium]
MVKRVVYLSRMQVLEQECTWTRGLSCIVRRGPLSVMVRQTHPLRQCRSLAKWFETANEKVESMERQLKWVAWSAVVCLAMARGAMTHAQPPRDIWGERIAAQPFERQPFREIRVPTWVSETIGCGYTLSVMDSKSRAQAAAHGVTISEMGFVDPFFAYYDSRLLKKRSPHVPPERLAQDIAEYKRLGVRILAVYPPTLQGEVYQAHPDWRRVATNTTEIPTIDMEKYPHGGMLCPLGPYGDFFIEVLAEILEKF